MKDVTTGTDTREPRALHDSIMTFDLPAELEALRAEPAWAEYGRAAKTLAKAATSRLVLALVRAGREVGDDDTWGPLAVHVLEGTVTADREGSAERVGPGGIAWFSAGGGWRARAVEDAALLISVTWPEDRAEEPLAAGSPDVEGARGGGRTLGEPGGPTTTGLA